MLDLGQQATERIYADVQRRLKSNYRQAVHEVQAKLDDFTKRHKAADLKMRKKLADGLITKEEYRAWQRGQVYQGDLWRKQVNNLTETLYSSDVIAQRIVNEQRLNVFASNANAMAYSMEHGEGLDFGFGYYDSATVSRILKDQPNLLPPRTVKRKEDVEWYHKIVNNCVTQGILQGEGIPAIAKRIAETTGERSYNAAVRNARTAMTSAQNAGRIEVMHEAERMGIKVKKRWLATLDDRTRDAHADLDGQVQEVDDYFESSLGPILFPGDPSAEPANLYNCRCTLIYEHPEYPSNFERRDNIDGEIIEDMTYREWENLKKTGDSILTNIYHRPLTAPRTQNTVVTASTIEEAERFAQAFVDNKRFGALGVSYKGISVDAANEANKTISEFYNLYAVDKFGGIVAPAGNTKIGALVKNAVAGYSPIRHSFILNRSTLKSTKIASEYFAKEKATITAYLSNPSAYEVKNAKIKRILDLSAKSGRATVPETFQEAIWHELGHSLEKPLRNVSNYEAIKNGFSQYAESISGYATTELSEYIAESFCAWNKGETIDTELAKGFLELRRQK